MLPCLCFRRFRPVTDRVHIVTNSHTAKSTGIECYHMELFSVKRGKVQIVTSGNMNDPFASLVWGLKAPPAEARGVLGGASTLPPSLSRRGKAALVWLHSDFWADALRHEGCPCFGAAPAPLSRVLWLARVLLAGAPPHLPNTAGTGHTREWDLLDRDRQPETRSTGHAAPARCRTGTGANAARAAW
jgi:hypothetical protein